MTPYLRKTFFLLCIHLKFLSFSLQFVLDSEEMKKKKSFLQHWKGFCLEISLKPKLVYKQFTMMEFEIIINKLYLHVVGFMFVHLNIVRTYRKI